MDPPTSGYLFHGFGPNRPGLFHLIYSGDLSGLVFSLLAGFGRGLGSCHVRGTKNVGRSLFGTLGPRAQILLGALPFLDALHYPLRKHTGNHLGLFPAQGFRSEI